MAPALFSASFIVLEAPAARFSTFYFFATGLAAGIAVALPLVPLRQIGRRFFILMTFVAIVFLALALAASGLVMSYFHVAFAALLILYNVLLPAQSGVDVSGRREARERAPPRGASAASTLALALAGAAGIAGLTGDALSYPELPGFATLSSPWLVVSFLSSSVLLGSAVTAMVLGHWYLVARKLSFTPLARLTLFFGAAVLVRMAAAAGAAWCQGERWRSLVSLSGPAGFFLGPGLFVSVRVVFGFLGPLAFVWMAWRCVEERSNQSATGILYVNLAFVLLGEIIAKYLLAEGLLV